ncbi:MAG TPA: DUF2283 domain-containing protein [Candidatus Paceibacterota bacterium]
MKINYDKIADAIYFKMSDGKITKTIKMNDRLVADLDNAGNVVGIEMLDVSNQLGDVGSLERNVLEGIPLQIISGTPATA